MNHAQESQERIRGIGLAKVEDSNLAVENGIKFPEQHGLGREIRLLPSSFSLAIYTLK